MDENAVEYVFHAYDKTHADEATGDLVVMYPIGKLTLEGMLEVDFMIVCHNLNLLGQDGIDLSCYNFNFVPLNYLPNDLPSRLDFEFRKNYFERQEPDCNYGPIVLTRLAIEYADVVRSIRKDTERAGETTIIAQEALAIDAAEAVETFKQKRNRMFYDGILSGKESAKDIGKRVQKELEPGRDAYSEGTVRNGAEQHRLIHFPDTAMPQRTIGRKRGQ